MDVESANLESFTLRSYIRSFRSILFLHPRHRRLPFTILKALRLQTLPDETLYGAHRRKSTSTSRGTEGRYAGEEVALAEHVWVKMRFCRHYREPDLVVEVRRDGRGVVEVEMEFDPVTNEWEVVRGLEEEIDVEND